MVPAVLYPAYQVQRDLSAPVTSLATLVGHGFGRLPPSLSDAVPLRWVRAAHEMTARARLTHARPSFSLPPVPVAGDLVPVAERVVDATPFARLLHFAKEGVVDQPRVLIVAALAGHFSTLLRPTAQALLPDFDVYMTDWHNGRDIPADLGPFAFDDYVAHVMRFLRKLGPGMHVVAVCQPGPATLAASALMAEDQDPATPQTLTLMAGPIDGRVSPTAVNRVATRRPLSWFERTVITTVPLRYPGAGRRVYPGFVQLGAFMSLNPWRHFDRQMTLFADLLAGRDEAATVTKAFYDEYFAVLDIPAEFYLETVDIVFQRFLLARGELAWRGRRVEPAAISRTALLTVEGERDDICGAGQTLAAHDLCRSIPASRRLHHVQPGVGHYGVFSGQAWEQQICPTVGSFIMAND
jgi:poly(3-hydroxybutyrate) depolymerase